MATNTSGGSGDESMTAHGETGESLIGALSKARIPAANHVFIGQLCAAIGIGSYRVVDRSDKPYVVAARRDGLRDLHIYYGYTTGFATENEIVRAVGAGAERGPSPTKGTWYVVHPVNQVRAGGQRGHDVRREGGRCACGMQLSVTGVCGSCD